MQRLTQEVKNQRERPEMKNVQEQELIKEAIRAFPESRKAPPAGEAPAAAAGTFQSPLPTYAQDAPAEIKLEIEYLLELTFREGLSKALREANKSSYFIEDAFRDALAGKLYPVLQKRGIVK